MNNTLGTISVSAHFTAEQFSLGNLNDPLTWEQLKAYIMDDAEAMAHGDIQGYSVFVECDSKEMCDV